MLFRSTTLLHEAARWGSVEAIRVLLEHGADVNARKKDDTTPLHQAARWWTVEVIHVLLEHGADVNARMNDDTTPLHQVARWGTVEAICVLLEHGANVGAEDGRGRTASQVVSERERDAQNMVLGESML